MYAYSVGYSDYECGGSVVLFHRRKFSQDAFDGMVVDAYVEAARRYLRRRDEENEGNDGSEFRARTQKYLEEGDLLKYAFWVAADEIREERDIRGSALVQRRGDTDSDGAVDVLIERHGFIPLEEAASFTIWASSDLSLVSPEDGDPHHGEGSTRLVASAIQEKVYRHSKTSTDMHGERLVRTDEILRAMGHDPDALREEKRKKERAEFLETPLASALVSMLQAGTNE